MFLTFVMVEGFNKTLNPPSAVNSLQWCLACLDIYSFLHMEPLILNKKWNYSPSLLSALTHLCDIKQAKKLKVNYWKRWWHHLHFQKYLMIFWRCSSPENQTHHPDSTWINARLIPAGWLWTWQLSIPHWRCSPN